MRTKEIKTKEVFRHWELDSILQILIVRGREATTKILREFYPKKTRYIKSRNRRLDKNFNANKFKT